MNISSELTWLTACGKPIRQFPQMERMLIPIGVAYAQLLEDVRAVVRHEIQYAPLTSAGHVTPPNEELLTVREAARLLDVTVQTVHEWKRRGLLKYHKLASRTYIKKTDLSVALSGHQRSAKDGKEKSRG